MYIDYKRVVMVAVELDRFTTINYDVFLMIGNILPLEI
jgi:hypothetical protein